MSAGWRSVVLMKESNVFKSSPQNLARMLDLNGLGDLDWQPNDLGAMLRHQLSMPVCFDLDQIRLDSSRQVRWKIDDTSKHSFGALFRGAGVSPDLLILSKDYAKASLAHPDSCIPRAIAEVIYYCSIAAALVHCGTRISQLDGEALIRCFQRAMDQPWLDESLVPLFQKAIQAISAIPEPSTG